MATANQTAPFSGTKESQSSGVLSTLIRTLRAEKYTFSKEEKKVLEKCNSRIKSDGIVSFITAGTTIWAVSGNASLIHRLTATVVGAGAGTYLVMKRSIQPCIQDILALDGSPMKDKLAVILQKQLDQKPHFRALLEKHYYLEPLYDDSNQNTAGVLMRKRESVGSLLEEPSGREVDYSDADSHATQTKEKASFPESPEKRSSQESSKAVTFNPSQVKRGSNAQPYDAPFEDPFELLLHHGWEGESKNQPSIAKSKASASKKRDKMGVLERREYNRMRYLHSQEKRNASEWANAPVE